MIDIKLTDAGKAWILEHYPQSIVWKYDVGTPFKLHSKGTDFVEITYLEIPYRIPHKVNG